MYKITLNKICLVAGYTFNSEKPQLILRKHLFLDLHNGTKIA